MMLMLTLMLVMLLMQALLNYKGINKVYSTSISAPQQQVLTLRRRFILRLASSFTLISLVMLMLVVLGENTHIDAQAVADQGDSV